ncbi:VPLPA-CTERM sorting domain-containing protein [Haematobacter genomosp. 1]|uniref:VPLPA-CTERM sorting domain-containing protein n=1 Tax=Haematobacter genomosp. 1 TaxID=366618 RepID=UPI00117B2F9E
MRAFALAAAACLGIAGQAEAITYYGTAKGFTPPPNENEAQAGADISFWSDDGWKTVFVTTKAVGRFSFANFDFGKAGSLDHWVGRQETYQFFAPEWSNLSVGAWARHAELKSWCWFGCEYTAYNDPGYPPPYGERLIGIADGQERIRFVLGALVPDVLPAPVPLPAAAPLLIGGAAALFGLRRRKR